MKIKQTNRTVFVVSYIENKWDDTQITIFVSEDEETASLYVTKYNTLLYKLLEHYENPNSNWFSETRSYEIRRLGGCWAEEVPIRSSVKK